MCSFYKLRHNLEIFITQLEQCAAEYKLQGFESNIIFNAQNNPLFL